MKRLLLILLLTGMIVASTPRPYFKISSPVAAFIQANIEAVDYAKTSGSFWDD